MHRWVLIPLILLFALISCSPQEQAQEPDYQKTKEITLDVLHTPEGKKAIQELMTEPEFKEQIVIKGKDVEEILSKSMTDEKSKKEWEKMLQKPEIAGSFYKATKKEQEELMKTLMKDPEYQKMMLDLLKDPQFSKHLFGLLKSQEARKEIMKIMEEALQVPTFQEKLMKLMEQSQKKKEGKEGGGGQKEGGGGQQEGGGGGESQS